MQHMLEKKKSCLETEKSTMHNSGIIAHLVSSGCYIPFNSSLPPLLDLFSRFESDPFIGPDV